MNQLYDRKLIIYNCYKLFIIKTKIYKDMLDRQNRIIIHPVLINSFISCLSV